ncbi:MAG TPA: hypothetical protein PLN69_06615 [bacterium]|nr:hypothetical protein [bacterium]
MAKKKAKTGEITLERAIPEFLEHLKEAGKNERTVAVYGRCLENAVTFFKADKQLGKLTPALVGQFFKSDAMTKKPNGKEKSEITITQGKRVFRMMLVWAAEAGHIADVPVPKSEMKGGAKQDADDSGDNQSADAAQGD